MPERDQHLVINETVAIPLREIWAEFSHSSGPGGQNVNKVSSQATLCFAVASSPSLKPEHKQRLFAALGNRISREGILRVTGRNQRSQAQNRAEALARLQALLCQALRPAKARRPTRPTTASRERRLRSKQIRSRRKAQRSRDIPLE